MTVLSLLSAMSMTAALRPANLATVMYNVTMSTAHPAKFTHTVQLVFAEEKLVSIPRHPPPAIC